MKTSLGIWALGSMVTRFVPGGYQPEWRDESTAAKVQRAVGGLGDLIDGYEFHYPQELSDANLAEVREALAGHDVYCVATGLHLDPLFGKGGLVSPDPEVREEARRRTRAAADFAGRIGAEVAAVRRSVLQWRFIDQTASRIDQTALREAQAHKDAIRAYELVYTALGA